MLTYSVLSQVRKLLPKPKSIGLGYAVAAMPSHLRTQANAIADQADDAMDQSLTEMERLQTSVPPTPKLIPNRDTGVVLAVAELVNRVFGGQDSVLPSYVAGRSVAIEEETSRNEREVQAKLNQAAMQMQRARLNQSAAYRKSDQLMNQAQGLEQQNYRHQLRASELAARSAAGIEEAKALKIDARRKFVMKALESTPDGMQLYLRHADAIDMGEVPEEVQQFLGRQKPSPIDPASGSAAPGSYLSHLSIEYASGLVSWLPKDVQPRARLGYRNLVDGAMQGQASHKLTQSAGELVSALESGLDTMRAKYRKDRSNVDLLHQIREIEAELFRIQQWIHLDQMSNRPYTPAVPKDLTGPIGKP